MYVCESQLIYSKLVEDNSGLTIKAVQYRSARCGSSGDRERIPISAAQCTRLTPENRTMLKSASGTLATRRLL
jgi:hypothetical protein